MSTRGSRSGPLARASALQLMLAARELGPAVAYEGAMSREEGNDCVGGLILSAACAVEVITMSFPGTFPTKAELEQLFLTLGLSPKDAGYYAANIPMCNDNGEIEAAWQLAAEALGVPWSELQQAIAAEQEQNAQIKMPQPQRPAHLWILNGRDESPPRLRTGCPDEELVEVG